MAFVTRKSISNVLSEDILFIYGCDGCPQDSVNV